MLMTWLNWNLESKNAAKAALSFEKRDGGDKEGWCRVLHVGIVGHHELSSYHAGQFPLGCSGKLRCGARVQQTLPNCRDDSTELQNHLYGTVIQGWFMTAGRRGLSRERRRAASFSETTSEKMSWIQTELWLPWVAITLWSVETGSCSACRSGRGLKCFRSYRAAHGSYTNNSTLGNLGQGLKCIPERSHMRLLLFTPHEIGHSRAETSHLRNQSWGEWKKRTKLDGKSTVHARLCPGSFLHHVPSP